METAFLAMDFGASSGRAMLGILKDGKLSIRQLHRFANEPVELNGCFYWDLPRLFLEIKNSLNKAALENIRIASIGIDTWGVDYGLLDRNGRPLGNPVHYRDTRTDGMMDRTFRKVGKQEIYERTGLAFLSFNTLYQLAAQVNSDDECLKIAQNMLFMPDLFSYFLTGKMGCEYTIASTSQMLSPYTRSWDAELLKKLDIPTDMLLPITEPGTIRGTLLPQIARETGVGEVPVVAVAGHDTASAVVAVPAQDDDFAYISSGTWSLVGIETLKPVISDEAQAANLTNEGGVDGTIRVLKNVMGLWIIQECQREWERRGKKLSFAEIVKEAEKEPAFRSLFDPDDDVFMTPGDMPGKIADYCCRTGQPVPETIGQTARAVYESLALKYRWTVKKLEKVRGKEIRALHIVGGGSNNAMLNQFTSDALGIPVITGPSEATAIGNLMMQAKALGLVKDMRELRRIVADSFDTGRVEPGDRARWDEAYAKFLGIAGLSE